MKAYYLEPKGEKLLVFDYMPKGSLANFLHGELCKVLKKKKKKKIRTYRNFAVFEF